MRVLLVANTLPPTDLSGVGEQVVQLATGLRERGHEVRVLGRATHGLAASKILFPLTIGWRLAREVRRFDPHVVQVHESDAGLALARCRRRRGGGRRPLLVALLQVSYCEERRAVRPLRDGAEIVGRPGAVERRFRRFKAPLQIALGRRTARAADLVLAPSAVTALEIEKDYGVALPAVVPNVSAGLPAGGSIPAPEPGEVRLLYVGRLRLRKGVEILLRALAVLAPRRPELRLVVAGDGEHRAALERLTSRLGIGDRVHFAGRADGAEVRAWMATAAALVVPSIYEGMPLVVLEAMDAALPVVASRVSGMPEVVVDGETGRLVPPESSGALAAAIEELLADPEEARRMGERGRARLDGRYRPGHAARIWEDAVLESLENVAGSTS